MSSLSNSTPFKEIALNPCSSDQCSVSPRIDGEIKTGEWRSAVSFGDLVQVRPIELGNPSEKTTILVMVSNSTLFIAAKLFYEQTENIVATRAILNHSFFFAIVIGIIRTSGGIGNIKLSIKEIIPRKNLDFL